MLEEDIVGIIGPNGAGKTTLFQCMLGIQNGYSGNISLFKQDVKKNKNTLRKIGYVPQKKSINQGFPATVKEIVSFGVPETKINRFFSLKSQNRTGNGGFFNNNIFQNYCDIKINKTIEIVGLSKLRDKRIGELSGGEQQKVLIAKALVSDLKLLILDEPPNRS